MFPRRDDATNKELILTLIDIQGYLSRYGKSHTNWHETLNEVIERLEQVEGEPQESKEVPQRMRGRWIEDGYNDEKAVCDQCGEPCATYIMGKPRDKYCKWCGADMRGEQDE